MLGYPFTSKPLFVLYLKFDSGLVKFNVDGISFSTHELNITRRIKNSKSDEFYGKNLLEVLSSAISNTKLHENIKRLWMIPKYFNYVLEYLRAKENEGFVLLNDKKIGSFILKEAKYYHI